MPLTYSIELPQSKILNTLLTFHLWYNRTSNFRKLKVFGCDAYLLIPKHERKSKFSKLSRKLVFVGYSQNGYHLWDPEIKDIIIGNDVEFHERNIVENKQSNPNFEREAIDVVNIENIIIPNDQSCQNINVTSIPLENVISPEVNSLTLLNNEHCMYHVEAFLNNYPSTVKEAKSRPDWPQWKQAMEMELENIRKLDTFELIENTPELRNKLISSKWVFTIKSNGLYKARLVAKGFLQNCDFSFQDIFSPVANLNAVRTLLCVALEKDFFICQLDITNAYLHAKLHEPVYMTIPSHVMDKVDKKKFVLKVTGALYGLQQAPKAWNTTLDQILQALKFSKSKSDPCLYFRKHINVIYILVYVDDLLLCSNNHDALIEVKNQLAEHCNVKELEDINNFLGICVDYNKKKGKLSLNQRNLIEKVAHKFQIGVCKPVYTPIEKDLNLIPVKPDNVDTILTVSYTHLTLPTIYSV